MDDGEIACTRARQKLARLAARNLAFRREFRVSADFRTRFGISKIRASEMFITQFYYSQRIYMHTHTHTHPTLRNVTRRTTLLHETETMRFTTAPYATQLALLRDPLFFFSFSLTMVLFIGSLTR